MTDHNPLELYTVSELFDELEKRFDHFAFAGHQLMADDRQDTVRWIHGCTFTALGVAATLPHWAEEKLGRPQPPEEL